MNKNSPQTITRILGIDPGLNVTGYGVIDFTSPQNIALVEAGIIRGGSSKKPMGTRLMALKRGMEEVIETLNPQIVALEELYSHYARPRTAILMGHARGVFCLTAEAAELTTAHYSATQIKRVITGNGRAPKSQIQTTIGAMLQLDEPPDPPDVADALAIAICHGCISMRHAALDLQ
ncbi:MAG: crossover junction endodeoxyribonuclease RuvC [Pirellulaceae bacterium]|nr:crossover junction endodeoxyribonuclease RuvC [Pirellulaceae bacterium]